MGRNCKPVASPFGFRAGAFALAGAAVASLGGAAHEGCSIYDPSLLQSDKDGSVGDGGDAASTTADAGYVCDHATVPPEPASEDDPDSGFTVRVIAAMDSIDLGTSVTDGGPLPSYGYDLDGVCTCPGPASCEHARDASITCDDSQGRDNTSLNVFRLLDVFSLGQVTEGTQEVNKGLQAGQNSLLIDIENYNGQQNDRNVSVNFYISNGLPAPADGGPPPRPAGDGTDSWTIDPGSLMGSTASLLGTTCTGSTCVPISYDNAAWVSGGQVVAHFQTLPLSFGTHSFVGGATIQLNDAVLVGKLVPVALSGGQGGSSYELRDGVIAGRWPTSQLLSTLAVIPAPPADVAMGFDFTCGLDPTYQGLKNAACVGADIFQSTMEDSNPAAACDAISFGLAFSAKPAQLGIVQAAPPIVRGCLGPNNAPFSDCCGCTTQP